MTTHYGLSKEDLAAAKPYEWDEKYDIPRDLIGYGEESLNPQWPNGAKIAVSFVINYEEVNNPSAKKPGQCLQNPGCRTYSPKW